jgi:hypothetical protein
MGTLLRLTFSGRLALTSPDDASLEALAHPAASCG